MARVKPHLTKLDVADAARTADGAAPSTKSPQPPLQMIMRTNPRINIPSYVCTAHKVSRGLESISVSPSPETSPRRCPSPLRRWHPHSLLPLPPTLSFESWWNEAGGTTQVVLVYDTATQVITAHVQVALAAQVVPRYTPQQQQAAVEPWDLHVGAQLKLLGRNITLKKARDAATLQWLDQQAQMLLREKKALEQALAKYILVAPGTWPQRVVQRSEPLDGRSHLASPRGGRANLRNLYNDIVALQQVLRKHQTTLPDLPPSPKPPTPIPAPSSPAAPAPRLPCIPSPRSQIPTPSSLSPRSAAAPSARAASAAGSSVGKAGSSLGAAENSVGAAGSSVGVSAGRTVGPVLSAQGSVAAEGDLGWETAVQGGTTLEGSSGLEPAGQGGTTSEGSLGHEPAKQGSGVSRGSSRGSRGSRPASGQRDPPDVVNESATIDSSGCTAVGDAVVPATPAVEVSQDRASTSSGAGAGAGAGDQQWGSAEGGTGSDAGSVSAAAAAAAAAGAAAAAAQSRVRQAAWRTVTPEVRSHSIKQMV